MKIRQGALIASLSREAGGLFYSVRGLVTAVNATKRCDVRVFGIRDEYSGQDLGAWKSVDVTAFQRRGPKILGFAPGVVKALCESHLDILHLHGIWMFPSVASRTWAKRTGKPYVVSAHGMLESWAVQHSRFRKKIAGRLYENEHLNGAACLRALCETEAESFRQYGLKNPICIIPNGVDMPPAICPGRPAWRSQVSSDTRFLLYLGRIHPKKGLVNLLFAWSLFIKSCDNDRPWQLVIAGWDQGGHEQQLKNLAKRLGVAESIQFIGPQFGDAKHACYVHADAVILPSVSEGLPMAVLESWSYRLPVLMTPQCNLSVGFDRGAAIRIDPEQDSIARSLIELQKLSEAERKTIGEKGYQLACERFCWSSIADQMLSVYEWILNTGPKPGFVIDS